jgi:hypothetical protein
VAVPLEYAQLRARQARGEPLCGGERNCSVSSAVEEDDRSADRGRFERPRSEEEGEILADAAAALAKRLRTTLLLASGLSLIGFLVYPTAPPRLAGIGIVDTVSNGHVDLNYGLVRALYNPYAAVPSMHVGYALIVAATLLRHGRHVVVRTLGALYPPLVLLVIVATGNHFFLDAAIGAITAALAAGLALVVTRKPTSGRVTRLRKRPPPFHERHGIAA